MVNKLNDFLDNNIDEVLNGWMDVPKWTIVQTTLVSYDSCYTP